MGFDKNENLSPLERDLLKKFVHPPIQLFIEDIKSLIESKQMAVEGRGFGSLFSSGPVIPKFIQSMRDVLNDPKVTERYKLYAIVRLAQEERKKMANNSELIKSPAYGVCAILSQLNLEVIRNRQPPFVYVPSEEGLTDQQEYDDMRKKRIQYQMKVEKADEELEFDIKTVVLDFKDSFPESEFASAKWGPVRPVNLLDENNKNQPKSNRDDSLDNKESKKVSESPAAHEGASGIELLDNPPTNEASRISRTTFRK